jgi:cytochrome c oxidase assembly protein subunit 15
MSAAGSPAAASIPGGGDDWRLRIPETRRRWLRLWLWTIAVMVWATVAVGGITRLRDAGLSIVAWEPVAGAVPPLSEAEWAQRFEAYRQFPEYRQLRRGMTLAEFKVIFFWEYLHRLIARAIGVVFLVPFVVFWHSGRLPAPLTRRVLALLLLGGAQGGMGWLMVSSGLVDRPSVSHYRLAAHLTLAIVILGAVVWVARDLAAGRTQAIVPPGARRLATLGVGATGVLLAAQIVWGALVAGLDAGRLFNTFPLMVGHVLPPGLFAGGAWLAPLVEQAAGVQWMHRLLGTVLLLAAGLAFARLRRLPGDGVSGRYAGAFFVLVGLQYLLGVLTLLRGTPLALAVGHQSAAIAIVVVWVAWAHHVRNLAVAPADARETARDGGSALAQAGSIAGT